MSEQSEEIKNMKRQMPRQPEDPTQRSINGSQFKSVVSSDRKGAGASIGALQTISQARNSIDFWKENDQDFYMTKNRDMP